APASAHARRERGEGDAMPLMAALASSLSLFFPSAPGFYVARPTLDDPVLTLRSAPRGRVLTQITNITDLGSPLVLGVVPHRDGWVGVISSALPNGRLGWVPRATLSLSRARVTITVSLSRHRLVVRRGGRAVRTLRVGIGGPRTPTPR